MIEEEEKENWESHLSMALAQSTKKKGVKVPLLNSDYPSVEEQDEYDEEQADAEEVVDSESKNIVDSQVPYSFLDESVIDERNDMNLCGLCFEMPIDISLEPCLHTFCNECIYEQTKKNQEG